MLRAHLRLRPDVAVTEVQQTFNLSDEYLATHCGVDSETVRNWRQGVERPSHKNLRHMQELLRLNEALTNARNGKYRQA